MPAGAGGHAQRDRALVGGAERARPAPGDLLQREAQRLGVGELAVEQRQRGLQRRQLGVGELDVGQVELLRAQRVVLLLGGAVGGLVDRERDAQRIELGAVGVEAAGERVLVHARVALDVAPDLRGGDGPPFRHQIGDQRELADELLGVLGHRPATLDSGARGVHGARRYFRPFVARWARACGRLAPRRCRGPHDVGRPPRALRRRRLPRGGARPGHERRAVGRRGGDPGRGSGSTRRPWSATRSAPRWRCRWRPSRPRG